MSYGKVIELFLVNGTADSLMVAELSNWNGKALKIPRIEVASCEREDIKVPGIYFLFCKNVEDDKDSVYIGETENLKVRLLQHIQDHSNGKEKYYWNTAVMFTGTNLDKALIRYLENLLVQAAKNANRYIVETKNTYGNTIIKESSKAAMEEFFDNIKTLINAMGYKVLEPMIVSTPESEAKELYIERGNAKAIGVVTSEGFVVRKGAVINEKTNVPSLKEKASDFRDKMIASNKVENFITQEDILFSSSSAAAVFVLGYSVSGPQVWKDKNGTELRELNI